LGQAYFLAAAIRQRRIFDHDNRSIWIKDSYIYDDKGRETKPSPEFVSGGNKSM
jgi:hypothetical protein